MLAIPQEFQKVKRTGQEARREQINNKTTPRLSTVKLHNTRDKAKVLKVNRE